MVDIKKFWIEGVLLEKYPNFHADQGADIDGNGKIEGSEAFGDVDGNGSLGDREDYNIYLHNNRGRILEKLGWYYEAIKSFEEARRLNPDFKVELTGLRNRLKIQRFISKYF